MLVEGKGVEDGLAQVVLAIHAMDAQGGAAMRRLHGHRETADHAIFHQVERRGGAHVFERVARDADALRPRSDRRVAGHGAVRFHGGCLLYTSRCV